MLITVGQIIKVYNNMDNSTVRQLNKRAYKRRNATFYNGLQEINVQLFPNYSTTQDLQTYAGYELHFKHM